MTSDVHPPRRGVSWRIAATCGVLLSSAVIARETLDWWLSPTTEFYARSVVSTFSAVSIFVVAGLWSAWRSRSVVVGVLTGAAAGAISAALVNIVSAAELAVRHDPHTMATIAASGGVDEIFLLPILVIVPGTCCALAGAIVGKAASGLRRSRLA
jgi:hypothetical protein